MARERFGCFTVACRSCREDWVISGRISELIIHPDERTYLAWSCPDCGPQSHPISTHQGVAWLNKLGVPIADWSTITPEDPGWSLWEVDELLTADKIGRSWPEHGGAMDKELRRLLEEAGT